MKKFTSLLLILLLASFATFVDGQTVSRARNFVTGNLLFGGSTSSFPMLKRSGVNIQAKLADDSDWANIQANSFGINNGAGGVTTTSSPADGVLLLRNNANNDFGRLQFGGTTSSFPALKRSTTGLQVRLADDSAFGWLAADTFNATSRLANGSGVTLLSFVAPTVTSAGTSPSVTGNNGAATFRVNVGTGGTATTIVMAMPTATTGWNCNAENITANAANRANQRVVQQSSTTTAVTLQNQLVSTGAAQAFTASDIVRAICFAY